jgi:hypothetical protein
MFDRVMIELGGTIVKGSERRTLCVSSALKLDGTEALSPPKQLR